MNRTRYALILRFIIIVIDSNDEPIPLDQFIDETLQLGKSFEITEHEVMDVLYTYKPFDFGISNT